MPANDICYNQLHIPVILILKPYSFILCINRMVSWIVFLSILEAYVVIFASASCRSGWTYHESTCYFFSHNHASWGEAEAICRGWSGKLAEPRTTSSAHFISGVAQILGGWFWLGMSDITVENNWIYSSDGVPVTLNYWGPGQPDKEHGSVSTEVNCLATWPAFQSKWSDEGCGEKYKFVCEEPENGNIFGRRHA